MMLLQAWVAGGGGMHGMGSATFPQRGKVVPENV